MKKLVFVLLLFCLNSQIFAFQQGLKDISSSDRISIKCGFQEVLKIKDKLNQQKQLPTDQFKKSNKVQLEVGDILSFFATSFKNQETYSLDAELRHKTDKTYIFVEKPQWDSGSVTQNDVDAFHQAFEISTPSSTSIFGSLPGASIDPNKGIRDISEENFGQPPNKTGDGYVYILIMDIRDNYEPETGNFSYIAGYFAFRDQNDGANSNKKDIIYVDANPGNPANEFALGTVAHEYQHLIHSRYDNNEETWLSEGFAEFSQQLCGYGIAFPSGYFSRPHTSLTTWAGNIEDYQRVGLWTVYLGEKFSRSLIKTIVQDPDNGIVSVRNALDNHGISLSFEEIFSNFTIANIANDPTIGDNGYFGYDAFRLPVLPIVTTTHPIYPVDPQQKSLSSYSTAYFRFTGRDSTAYLQFTGNPDIQIAASILERGDQDSVYSFPLDSSNQGEMSLARIGEGVTDMILIAANFGITHSYSYSVTSSVVDLSPPRITLGPRETLSFGSSISIYWETDELSTSIMQLGETEQYGLDFVDDQLTVTHRVTINNLQPNTTYHYRVGSTDQRGNGPRFSADFTFITPTTTSTAITTVQQTHSYGNEGRNIVVSSNGDIHIIYHEIVGQRRFVFAVKSSDNGENFSNAIQIDNSLFFGGMPSIAIDSADRLHIAWHAQEETSTDKFKVYYSRSDDGGDTWTAPKLVSKTYTADENLYAAIAIDPSGNPHIVWNSVLPQNDPSNLGDVYHNFSGDGGETWPDDKMIASSEDHVAFVPTIDFSSNGKAYVLYSDGVFNNGTSFAYAVTSDDYQQWTPPEAISSSGVLFSNMVSFTIDPQNNVHAVFSDNFNGTFHIMYTKLDVSGTVTGWTTPIPVAQSIIFRGAITYPNISVDENSDLYLLYLDGQEQFSGGSSLGKPAQKIIQHENSKALPKVTQHIEDAYLTIFRNGVWLPAANITNDTPDTDFAELPNRVSNGVIDILWMRAFSASNNQITFLHLDTKQGASLIPPKISSVFPENGATDVPYFKQILNISAVYDQRITADSLNSSNVIVSSSSGIVLGEILYDESQRTMTFIPAENLPADDDITVTITTSIEGSSGLPLDGNGNGQPDGSPEDDFSWSFHTQKLDVVAPTLTIGVLQNPVLTRYVDLYVVASEDLLESPHLTLNNSSVNLTLLNEAAHIYKGDTKITSSGVLELEVTASDFANNSGNASKSFSAQLLIARESGNISSPGGEMNLYISSGSLHEDTYLTVVKLDEPFDPESGKSISKSSLGLATYLIGPPSLTLKKDGELSFTIIAPEGKTLQLEQKNETGDWKAIPSKYNNDRLSAKIAKLGTFRVVTADPIIPIKFALQQNYPNPFTPKINSTVLTFDLPFQESIEISIFNILGQKVKTLFAGVKKAGSFKILWDGLDERNIPVASGVYIYQLKASKTILNKKMLILQ